LFQWPGDAISAFVFVIIFQNRDPYSVQVVAPNRALVMESSLARLLLLLEKLEPKNQQGLIGSTEKNSGLKSLIF
jgi:hypothetical protein